MNIMFMKKDELKEYCAEKSKKVIVYGEDIMEENGLSGIHDIIECIWIEDSKQEEKFAHPVVNEMRIGEFSDFEERFIILISCRHYRDAITYFKNNFSDDIECVFCIEQFGIKSDDTMTAAEYEKKRLYDASLSVYKRYLDVKEYSEEEKSAKMEYFCRNVLKDSEKKLIIPKIVFLATTRCTLKCKGCVGLIPDFDSPEDFEFEVIRRDIDKTVESADMIIAAEIGGGEPFLYKSFIICE